MRASSVTARFICISGAIVALLAAPAAAQEAFEDPALDEEPVSSAVGGDGPRYGVGLRLRYIAVPKSMIELFMEEAASGVGSPGIGVEFVRRKGDLEFAVGLEYENLSPDDGIYIEGGGGTNQPGTTDFVEFDGFSWIALDVSWIFHKELSDVVALRYGGGFGLGLIMGDIYQTDAICTGENAQADCIANPNGAQVNDPADLPPVFPVVNILGGVQFTPMEQLRINVELGLHTVPYLGVGGQYYF